MRNPRQLFILWAIIVFTFVLTACSEQEQMLPTTTLVSTNTPKSTETQEPTSSPTPTNTNTPKPTDTPIPTDTPKPTATPTMQPLALDKIQVIEESGFSFQSITGFVVDIQANQAAMVSADDEIVLFMAVNSYSDTSSLAEVLNGFVQQVGGGELEAGEPYPFAIGIVDGLGTDVTGEFLGNEITGRVAVVAPDDARLFLAYGFAIEERWETEGNKVYNMVVDTITFFEPGNAPSTPPTETASSFHLPLPSGIPDSEWNGMPIMPEASAGEGDNASYYFTAQTTVDEVQSYYEEEMAKLGWRLLAVGTGENDALLIIFQKDAETTTVSVFSLEDDQSYVFLVQ